MRSWYFCEQEYWPAWERQPNNPRISAPSGEVDPKVAHKLLNEYIEECVLCDKLGLNIMVNEHHASYTCMSVSCMVTLGMLATRTSRARLLALGIPIMSRIEPHRVAEEIGYVDTVSGGRVEIGLIKGSPFELFLSNSAPADSNDRYWEAHDLVIEMLKRRDGPFSWEGEHFNYRYANIIPPCYQQPHPPLWLTTLNPKSALQAAQLDYVVAIVGIARAARESFPVYREEYRRVHGREASLDRFAYLGYVSVAEDEDVALERAGKLLKFSEASERIPERFVAPPAMLPPEVEAGMLQEGRMRTHRTKTLPDGTPMSNPPTPREQIINNAMFAGNPDQVFEQIKEFYDSVGGFGNFLVQMGGTMTHEEKKDSISLFAKHVQPRLEELTTGRMA